jgi:predicted RNase H-like HicB family nuclease
MAAYIGLIRKEAKSDFGVEFPDFPGCITAAKTLSEAQSMAQEALNAHIQFLAEDGEILPEPSSLEVIMAKKSSKGAVAIMVEAINPYAVKRVNLTFREDILEKIDRFTRARGLTRSSFLATAAVHELKRAQAI